MRERSMIAVEWLQERLNTTDPMELARRELEQLEIDPADWDSYLAGADLARWLSKWVAFLEQIVPRDELWTYASPTETWEDLAVAAGYAIVRHGKPIYVLNSRRN
jgi:hypothetical protein